MALRLAQIKREAFNDGIRSYALKLRRVIGANEQNDAESLLKIVQTIIQPILRSHAALHEASDTTHLRVLRPPLPIPAIGYISRTFYADCFELRLVWFGENVHKDICLIYTFSYQQREFLGERFVEFVNICIRDCMHKLISKALEQWDLQITASIVQEFK